MNEEVNSILQVYQARINNLTAQNIAFEAKILTLTKQIQSLQTPQQPETPETVDGEKDLERRKKLNDGVLFQWDLERHELSIP